MESSRLKPAIIFPGSPPSDSGPDGEDRTVAGSRSPSVASLQRSQKSLLPSRSITHSPRRSPRHSPKPSRDSSPTRLHKSTAAAAAARSRSRRSGPTSAPTLAGPLAAPATDHSVAPPGEGRKRASVAAGAVTPSFIPTVDRSTRSSSQERKDSRSEEGSHVAKTHRLKSPPPSASAAQAARLFGQTSTAPVLVQRPPPVPGPSLAPFSPPADADPNFHLLPSGMRTPVRGASLAAGSLLETVQEGSAPSTPAAESAVNIDPLSSFSPLRHESARRSQNDRDPVAESSSDSGDVQSSGNDRTRRVSARANTGAPLTRAYTVPPSAAYGGLNAKAKVGPEASIQSMTVETETVRSVPQAARGGSGPDRAGSVRMDGSGAPVRLKVSMETIKPKKERKRAMRRPTSVTAGTASSRADVFEARIASAVDEADSSDSDETFVYESNPPDPHAHRPARHHSRTPSSTSLHSQLEARASAMFGNHNLVGKRSMKFTNNAYVTSDPEALPGIDSPGLGRGSSRGAGATSAHHVHHHIGHWGNANRTGPDPSAPVAAAHKPYRSGTAHTSRQSSRATSPRTMHAHHRHHHRVGAGGGGGGGTGGGGAKKHGQLGAYEIDLEGADDERTPLVGSLRAGRRRTPGGAVRGGYAAGAGVPGTWRTRVAGCLALAILVLMVVVGGLAFVLATTKPLRAVRVLEIQNVLASEEQMMLDLLVEAINPNILPVTVGGMDINVFAKSRYVHSDPPAPTSSPRRAAPHTQDGIDTGTDPIPPDDDDDDQPETDSQTMLLGRIFHFDSAPTFEGAAWYLPLTLLPPASAIGEVRLAQPGNRTEAGGSARWNRVLQHPFELIVRGVLQYELPLLRHRRTAPIGASVLVHPEQGVDRNGRMWLEPVPGRRPYEPGSNVGLTPPRPPPRPLVSTRSSTMTLTTTTVTTTTMMIE
ncbi:MAG: hypothetical protein M1826_006720 [Phylliscum demangeonii]|nr:MAG: hypothetical protein M1826_006720 [Phylliscum demangeonii]